VRKQPLLSPTLNHNAASHMYPRTPTLMQQHTHTHARTTAVASWMGPMKRRGASRSPNLSPLTSARTAAPHDPDSPAAVTAGPGGCGGDSGELLLTSGSLLLTDHHHLQQQQQRQQGVGSSGTTTSSVALAAARRMSTSSAGGSRAGGTVSEAGSSTGSAAADVISLPGSPWAAPGFYSSGGEASGGQQERQQMRPSNLSGGRGYFQEGL